MENKKEISLEDFMSVSWTRLKQLIFAQSTNTKETEHTAEEENDKHVEEGEDQDEIEDESEPVEEEVKYTEPEELDESQYDEETKLIVEGNDFENNYYMNYVIFYTYKSNLVPLKIVIYETLDPMKLLKISSRITLIFFYVCKIQYMYKLFNLTNLIGFFCVQYVINEFYFYFFTITS